jgi:CHAT domain-containing protein/tetratricopeptide (TPR) repeat protein
MTIRLICCSLGLLVSAVVLSQPKPDSTRIVATIEQARIYYDANQLPEAIHTLTPLVREYQKTPLSSTLRPVDGLKAFYRLAFYQSKLNELSASRQTAIAGLTLGNRYPHYFWTADLYGLIAYLDNTTGDYEQAAKMGERGGELGQLAPNTYSAANGFFEQAKALRSLERFDQGHIAIDRAIRLAEADNSIPYDLTLYYSCKATLYVKQQQYQAAETYFNKAIKLNNSLRDDQGLGDNLTDLGRFYFQRRQYQKAIPVLESVIRIHPMPHARARALDILSLVCEQQARYEKALDYNEAGLNQLLAGTSSKRTGKLLQSPQLRIAPHHDYLFDLIQHQADTWFYWASATQNNPTRLRNALRTYALADTMIDFMRWEHTGQQSKLFWRGKTHRLYEQAIETAFRLNDAASAFRFMEKSRAVLLNDKLNELGASRQLDPAQFAREQQLRQRVADWQAKVATEKPNTPIYAKYLDSLRTVQEQQEAFVRELERTNPAYYRYKYDNQTIPLSRVKDELTNRKASLLTYFIGDSTLYTLSITPNGTKLLRLPANTYTKPAAELLALNANPDALNRQFAHYLTVANQLYRTLLAPLKLPPGRVIVSPDGVLLPFEALSTSATKPDFLVNQYAFSYAYSLNQLFKESTDAGNKPGWFSRSGSFLGIAPVTFSARLGQVPLAGSDAVLSRIGGQFSTPALLTGVSATRRAFSGQAGQYRIIQLFTHADADSTDREPTLFFADSTLRLSELTTTGQLPAELVGLSACKTGIGANQRGEGVFSLARGFASLGVPSVLTTLWNVENQATYALTELFYTKLAEGLSKDVALQQAKIAYLANADLSDQLPNRWAGLLLVGNAEPIKKQLPYTSWVGGFGVVAGLGGAWWIHRRRQRLH